MWLQRVQGSNNTCTRCRSPVLIKFSNREVCYGRRDQDCAWYYSSDCSSLDVRLMYMFRRYMLHPLFIGSAVAYWANRIAVRHTDLDLGWFMNGYFNDVLTILVLVPIWAAMMALISKREYTVTTKDVLMLFVIWSVMFEIVAPAMGINTGDIWDIVAYGTGGVIFWWFHVKSVRRG